MNETENSIKDQTKAGHVYILSNPAMQGIVKVGRTCKSGRSRAKELYSQGGTAIPLPFKMEFEMWSDDCNESERVIHQELSTFRVSNSREFFRIGKQQAIEAVIRVISYNHDLFISQPDTLIRGHELIDSYGEKTAFLTDELFGFSHEMVLVSAIARHLDIESVIHALHRYKKEIEMIKESRSISLLETKGGSDGQD